MIITVLSAIALAAASSSLDVEQLSKNAIAGDGEAAFALGQAYRVGDRVPLDAKEAARWFLKAAQLGQKRAGAELGLVLYQSGQARDALPWLTDAATAGDPRAQYTLGVVYYSGAGVPINSAAAKLWVSRAAKAGLPAAKEALAIMAMPLPADPSGTTAPSAKSSLPVRLATAASPKHSPSRKSGEDWSVQLGAFKDARNARALLAQSRHEAVGSLTLTLAARDNLTLLRLGSFESRDRAAAFCREKQRAGRACLVVRTAT